MYQVLKRSIIVCLVVALTAVGLERRLNANILTAGQSITYSDGFLASDNGVEVLEWGQTGAMGGSAVLTTHTIGGGFHWTSLDDVAFSTGTVGFHKNQECSVGFAGASAIMQSDGNFVLRSAGNVPCWTTHTENNPGAYLRMQDDTNLVVYSSSNAPLWAIF